MLVLGAVSSPAATHVASACHILTPAQVPATLEGSNYMAAICAACYVSRAITRLLARAMAPRLYDNQLQQPAIAQAHKPRTGSPYPSHPHSTARATRPPPPPPPRRTSQAMLLSAARSAL